MTIDDEDYAKEQKTRGWLVKCTRFFREYYGVAPLEIIYKLFRLKARGSIDEMINLLWSTPIDMIGCCIFSADEFDLDDFGFDGSLDTDYGYLINTDLLEDGEFFYLIEEQEGKDFYIPSAAQLLEITNDLYESSSSDYKKLKAFFKQKLDMTEELAINWCLQIWMNSYNGDMPSEVINKLSDSGVIFDGETQINKFMTLVMHAHNSTRLRENRGHTPVELRPSKLDRMPTIVPGSSQAAAILQNVQPELSKMGIPVELGRKVYPNDPCPCGSGKKYKKCCGR